MLKLTIISVINGTKWMCIMIKKTDETTYTFWKVLETNIYTEM